MMKQYRIVMIVGSFRKNSLNRQAAEKIVDLLRGRAEVSYLTYDDIPYMNQDLEACMPRAVERVRREVAAADAVWIVTPEYNRSYPGLLKNLLDWLSRPVDPASKTMDHVLMGKKVAVSGVGGRVATQCSRKKLFEVLDFIQAKPMKDISTGIAQGEESFRTDQLMLTEEDVMQLQWQADLFLESIHEA